MHTYACSDLHGNYKIWKHIQEYCKDDRLFFLGDACDRGKDGLKIIEELLKSNNVTYLKGNHEQLLLDAIRCVKKDWCDYNGEETQLLIINGGLSTLKDFMKKDLFSRLWYENKLNSLEECHLYKNNKSQNIILSHAGLNIENFMPEQTNFLWDRKHIHIPWPKDPIYDNWYIVHGHTPVQVFTNRWKVFRYADGHKIDIDCGTFRSGIAALLDLDTFDVIYFTEQGALTNDKINPKEASRTF